MIIFGWSVPTKLSGLAAQPVEVHCVCPPVLAVARYNARVTHPVHVVTALQLEAMAEYDRPVGIGALVAVDTTVPVDVSAVAAAVRSGGHGPRNPGASHAPWDSANSAPR